MCRRWHGSERARMGVKGNLAFEKARNKLHPTCNARTSSIKSKQFVAFISTAKQKEGLERMDSRNKRRISIIDTVIVVLIWLLCTVSNVESFSVMARSCCVGASRQVMTLSLSNDDDDDSTPINSPNMELAWRFAKKPLLRIGSKGATQTHGNSLRQLLNDHTAVKVKINTGRYGAS